MEKKEILVFREVIASQIIKKLNDNKENLQNEFHNVNNKINSFVIDNILDNDTAIEIHKAFPSKDLMVSKKSIREFKNIAAQMDQYNPIVEEAVYAFQDARVIAAVSEITRLKELLPDENLYAGGISLMSEGNFLNPHLDNSHDKDRENYRVINLLYYATPDWKQEYGGNLELWDNGINDKPRELVSRFNRLVVMITNKKSIHSVNKVLVDKNRCCVSNYYFSPVPAEDQEYFHVTSFYGRPEEKIKKMFLAIDSGLRNTIRKIFKKGISKTTHLYIKK